MQTAVDNVADRLADGARHALPSPCLLAQRCHAEALRPRAGDASATSAAMTSDDAIDSAMPLCRRRVVLRGGPFDGQDVFLGDDEWIRGVFVRHGFRYVAVVPSGPSWSMRVFAWCDPATDAEDRASDAQR